MSHAVHVFIQHIFQLHVCCQRHSVILCVAFRMFDTNESNLPNHFTLCRITLEQLTNYCMCSLTVQCLCDLSLCTHLLHWVLHSLHKKDDCRRSNSSSVRQIINLLIHKPSHACHNMNEDFHKQVRIMLGGLESTQSTQENANEIVRMVKEEQFNK